MQQNKQQGFTLIEVMVTIAIIAVGMLAMGSMLINDMRFNQNAEHRVDGAGIAQSVMTLALNSAETTAGYNGQTIQFSKIPSGQAVVTVVNGPTVAQEGREIVVTFSWLEHGFTKQVVLRSWGLTE